MHFIIGAGRTNHYASLVNRSAEFAASCFSLYHSSSLDDHKKPTAKFSTKDLRESYSLQLPYSTYPSVHLQTLSLTFLNAEHFYLTLLNHNKLHLVHLGSVRTYGHLILLLEYASYSWS